MCHKMNNLTQDALVSAFERCASKRFHTHVESIYRGGNWPKQKKLSIIPSVDLPVMRVEHSSCSTCAYVHQLNSGRWFRFNCSAMTHHVHVLRNCLETVRCKWVYAHLPSCICEGYRQHEVYALVYGCVFTSTACLVLKNPRTLHI